MNMAWRLLKLALPIKGEMLLATLLGALTVASGIGLMATSAYLISAAALHPSVAALQIAIVGVRFFGIARGVFRYIERLVSHDATFRLLARMRTWLYRALEPLVPARLLEYRQRCGDVAGYRSGDLLSRVVADIETLQNFYLRVLAPPLVAVLIGVAMWILLGAFDRGLAFIFLVFFLLSSVGIPLLTYLAGRGLGRQMVITRAQLNAHLVDGIQGMADLLAFGQEEIHQARIEQIDQRLSALQRHMAHLSGVQSMLSNLFMNLTAWTMLLVAIPMIAAGHLNGIYLALLVLTVLSGFEAVLPLPAASQQMGASMEAARRLFEIIDAEPVIHDPVTDSPTPIGYQLAVEHLSFRYEPDGPQIVNDVSFTVPEGHFTAIIGESGAGKSTIVHLLLRFWDYQEGHIRLGGHELRDYRQEDLYRLMSVVEQDTHLFNTTIRENILLACPDASEEAMMAATRQAQIHEFILSLPQGYETQVGEQGLRLSGGERQRLALARAFLKDAPLLILDEPTVNLDALTAREVLNAIRKLSQGRTTLMITHRLVELAIADEILVLHEGRVVQHTMQNTRFEEQKELAKR